MSERFEELVHRIPLLVQVSDGKDFGMPIWLQHVLVKDHCLGIHQKNTGIKTFKNLLGGGSVQRRYLGPDGGWNSLLDPGAKTSCLESRQEVLQSQVRKVGADVRAWYLSKYWPPSLDAGALSSWDV